MRETVDSQHPDWLEEFEYNQNRLQAPILQGRFEDKYIIEDLLERPQYELGDKYARMSDPVWGEALIGDEPHDQLLIELARTPLLRRMQSIEQLTLNHQYATMPNSMYFSRWQHIWGSAIFVRKMTENDERFDDRERMVLQLRTLLSDVGHTAFSHLGDWIFQGVDGGEDLHDKDLKDLLQVCGIEDLLEKHGFTVSETVFPEVEDWVECPSPDLCVDRVDYGLREAMRWVVPSIPLHMFRTELTNPKSLFALTDDQRLAITDPQFARYFSAAFSLLPTEHWSHPIHRLQLQLFQSAVQNSIVDKVKYDQIHPRDAMFGIDADFYPNFQTWDMVHLDRVMRSLAETQRQIFVTGRRADLNHIFEGIRQPEWTFGDFPDPLEPYTWQSREYGVPFPAHIELQEANVGSSQPFSVSSKGLQVNLPALKSRNIDPLVMNPDGTTSHFSDVEPTYADYTEQQRQMMLRGYMATVLMRRDVAGKIYDHQRELQAEWDLSMGRERSRTELARIVKEVEGWAAVNRLEPIFEVDDEHFNRTSSLGKTALTTGE